MSITVTAFTVFTTLSLHDALPIFFGQLHHDSNGETRCRGRRARFRIDLYPRSPTVHSMFICSPCTPVEQGGQVTSDRKSTRLNSSHVAISYAVFCLIKKMTRMIAL